MWQGVVPTCKVRARNAVPMRSSAERYYRTAHSPELRVARICCGVRVNPRTVLYPEPGTSWLAPLMDEPILLDTQGYGSG